MHAAITVAYTVDVIVEQTVVTVADTIVVPVTDTTTIECRVRVAHFVADCKELSSTLDQVIVASISKGHPLGGHLYLQTDPKRKGHRIP